MICSRSRSTTGSCALADRALAPVDQPHPRRLHHDLVACARFARPGPASPRTTRSTNGWHCDAGHLGFAGRHRGRREEAVGAAASTPLPSHPHGLPAPRLDGYQATGEIRRPGIPSSHPIIAVTGSGQSRRQRCLAAGWTTTWPSRSPCRRSARSMARWGPDGGGARRSAKRRSRRGRRAVPRRRPALDAHVVARLERLGLRRARTSWSSWRRCSSPTPPLRRRLRQAIAGRDTAAVRRSAHTLSGTSANLGATELARLCAVLAADGRRPRWSVAWQVDGIEVELDRVPPRSRELAPAA